jgi:hypothetical protein
MRNTQDYSNLEDKTLAHAYRLLRGNTTTVKDYTDWHCTEEMKSILKEDTNMCQPISHFKECLDYLEQEFTDDIE